MAGALEVAYGSHKRMIAAELAFLYEMARDPWRASRTSFLRDGGSGIGPIRRSGSG